MNLSTESSEVTVIDELGNTVGKFQKVSIGYPNFLYSFSM